MEKSFKTLFSAVLAFSLLIVLGCENKKGNDYGYMNDSIDTVSTMPDAQHYQEGDNTDCTPNDCQEPQMQPARTAATPDDAYQEGYHNGYTTGMEDGEYGLCREHNYDISTDYHDYDKSRYIAGYEEGYEDGYNEGHAYYEDSRENDNGDDYEDDAW